jgi:hypothetical protein
MKTLAALVVLGMSALLVPSSLNAQRGMSGHGGGGGSHASSGFRSAPSSGFHSGPSGGFRSAPGGFRSGPGFSSFGPVERRGGFTTFGPGRTFASRGVVSSQHVFVTRPFGFRRFNNRPFGFFGNCFGCGSPFFFGSGLFLGSPFFPYYPGGYYGGFYDDSYGYGPPAQQSPVAVNTDNGSTVQLAAEVQQLSDEVNDLRSEDSRRYAQDRAAAANSGTSMSAKEPAVSTVFVFRDGRRISASSYAIAGVTLWIFNENTARKYQISDLDAAATEQVNAANGVEFHVPAPPPNH